MRDGSVGLGRRVLECDRSTGASRGRRRLDHVDRRRRLEREVAGDREALVGGRDQAVAGPLGDEAGAVGGEQDLLGGEAVARERRDADRDADLRSRRRPSASPGSPRAWTAARTRSATPSADAASVPGRIRANSSPP